VWRRWRLGSVIVFAVALRIIRLHRDAAAPVSSRRGGISVSVAGGGMGRSASAAAAASQRTNRHQLA